MIRTLIFKTILSIYFVIWAPILLVSLISGKLCKFCVGIEVRGVMALARIIAGIKWQIHNPLTEENGIPMCPNGNTRQDGRAIIAAKHMSILEIAILYTVVPNSFFITKREITWFPIYGLAFLRIGMLPVNRTRGKTNMKKLEMAVAKKIMDGRTLIIFPEGTRTTPGHPIPIRRGLLFLAHELKLPITPVGTDTGLYWPKHGRMHPGTANVWFEEMLPSTATPDDVYEAINRHSA